MILGLPLLVTALLAAAPAAPPDRVVVVSIDALHPAALAPLFGELERRGSYYLVVTNDHAGHEQDHGTDHPEDGLLPLVLRSDRQRLPDIQGKRFEITGLRAILAPVFIGDRR